MYCRHRGEAATQARPSHRNAITTLLWVPALCICIINTAVIYLMTMPGCSGIVTDGNLIRLFAPEMQCNAVHKSVDVLCWRIQ
jgi:hypothetical protein